MMSIDDSTLPPESDTPPPDWMPDSSNTVGPPPMGHDSDHDSDHHDSSAPETSGGLKLYDSKHHPYIIYDVPAGHDSHSIDYDHHYHDHHHDVWTTTTPVPPTEPPAVKEDFIRYPVVLKLWYINIAWGIWFVFYCMYLILKSIGRHWVS